MRELAGQISRAVTEGAADVARAAERGVEADEHEPDRDRRSCRQRDVARRERDPAQPQPQEQEAGSEDEDATAVSAQAARTDDDEDECADDGHEGRPEQRGAEEPRHQEQRLDLVRDPVEAHAAVGVRPEGGEGARLLGGREHAEIDGEDREQCRCERQPPARDGCESQRAAADDAEQCEPDCAGARDVQRAERERRREGNRADEQRGTAPEGRAEDEREQPEERDEAEDDVRGRAPGVVRLGEPGVELPELALGVRVRRAR